MAHKASLTRRPSVSNTAASRDSSPPKTLPERLKSEPLVDLHHHYAGDHPDGHCLVLLIVGMPNEQEMNFLADCESKASDKKCGFSAIAIRNDGEATADWLAANVPPGAHVLITASASAKDTAPNVDLHPFTPQLRECKLTPSLDAAPLPAGGAQAQESLRAIGESIESLRKEEQETLASVQRGAREVDNEDDTHQATEALRQMSEDFQKRLDAQMEGWPQQLETMALKWNEQRELDRRVNGAHCPNLALPSMPPFPFIKRTIALQASVLETSTPPSSVERLPSEFNALLKQERAMGYQAFRQASADSLDVRLQGFNHFLAAWEPWRAALSQHPHHAQAALKIQQAVPIAGEDRRSLQRQRWRELSDKALNDLAAYR